MKVADLMSREVNYCTPNTDLAAVAAQMWNADCGALPVVNDDGEVVGMITDRDICIAAGTKHQDIANITVGEVRTGAVQSCAPDTNINDALKIFGKARVRRLPVVDENSRLQGILSITDIVRHAEEAHGKKAIAAADVLTTLKAICAPNAKAAAAGA